jgi:hypothetical protein
VPSLLTIRFRRTPVGLHADSQFRFFAISFHLKDYSTCEDFRLRGFLYALWPKNYTLGRNLPACAS